MIGKPRYKRQDVVCFEIAGMKKTGVIEIVDAYGTFFQDEEPSYDIMVNENNEECLYKHIPESYILNEKNEK